MQTNYQFYIETKRLIMRDMLPTDDEGMFLLDSDPEVHRYLGNKPFQSIEQSRKIIDYVRTQYTTNGIGRWAVIEKETNCFIGWAGLKLVTEPINGYINFYDIGYRLIKQFWGKGYATETAIASVEYARNTLQLKELIGMANINNVASRKILEKIGMQQLNTFNFEDITCVCYKISF